MIQALQKLTATGDQLYAKVCTVHHVDKENKRCDVVPVDGSAELFDIPLQADVQGTGLCFYPAKDSHVLVVFTNKHHACICNVSEVDLMKLAIDKMEFSVDKDKFSIKNEEMEFAVDKAGLNLKNEKMNLLVNKEGLNLEKGESKFLVDSNGMGFKKGGAEFVVGSSGITLKTESESLKKLMDELFKAILNMKFMTPGGPTPGPTTLLITAATFTALQTKFDTFFKD